MSTAAQATSSGGSGNSGSSSSKGWGDVAPKHVDQADTMPKEQVAKVWAKIYQAAGAASASEEKKKGVRAAVYAYGLINGTSREGGYQGRCTLFDGSSFPASVIATAAGKMEIRQFFRANMDESYDFFKESGYAESLPRVVSKAASLSIKASEAFAMADWMSECPKFTPAEQEAYNKSFTYSISRARKARGDHALEEVEGKRLKESLESQGPSTVSGRDIDF